MTEVKDTVLQIRLSKKKKKTWKAYAILVDEPLTEIITNLVDNKINNKK